MSRLSSLVAGAAKALHRTIVFSPRSAVEVRIFAEKFHTVLSMNPHKIHLTDLDEFESGAGLFQAIRIALACGADPSTLVPHVAGVADRKRMSEGKCSFKELQKFGINEALVVSGIPKGFDVTRKGIGKFYSHEAQLELLECAKRIPSDFRVLFTLYPNGHPATLKTLYEGLSEEEVLKFEIANLVKKAELFCDVTNRDPAELISGYVLQHSYDPQQFVKASEMVRSHLGEVKIVQAILPLNDTRLFRTFCREGFADISSAVESAVRSAELSKDEKEKLAADKDGKRVVIKLVEDIVRSGCSDVGFYAGKNPEELREIIHQCCGRGIFANLPHPDQALSSAAARGVVSFAQKNQLS